MPLISALLYLRVSSLDQEKEGYSLDAQEKLGLDYARRKNLDIVRTWKISESAWRSERTAFGQMIEYAKRHPEIRHIIFDVTDRMTRNDFDKMKIYDLIKAHDKTVHFSRTNKIFNRASGSDDEFMLDIEVAVAKKMSNDISRKSQMGMIEKAEQGFYPSVAPLGYRNNPITHIIEVDTEKAPLIRKAFELMGTGSYSLDMALEHLQAAGLTNKKGGKLVKPSLYYLLNNQLYYGAFEWKGKQYQGSHTPLIGKDLFDRVQAVLHARFHPSRTRRDFAFNNLIQCGLCGCKVLGEEKKKRYTYYHCTFTKGRHEGRVYIPEERLASLFEETIRRINLPPEIADWLNEGLKEQTAQAVSIRENRFRALKAQLEKAENRLSRLYNSKFDGEIAQEVFQAKESEYRRDVSEIKSQISAVSNFDVSNTERAFQTLELSKTIQREFIYADAHEKAKLLKLVASNFVLDGENLVPSYRKPFNWIAEGSQRLNWLPVLDEIRNWVLSPTYDGPAKDLAVVRDPEEFSKAPGSVYCHP